MSGCVLASLSVLTYTTFCSALGLCGAEKTLHVVSAQVSPSIETYVDATKNETRDSLMAQLQSSQTQEQGDRNDTEVSVMEPLVTQSPEIIESAIETVEAPKDPIRVVPSPTQGALYTCDGLLPSNNGEVFFAKNIAVSFLEGARLIRVGDIELQTESVSTLDGSIRTEVPERTIQFYQNPLLSSRKNCIQESVVGIRLDGKFIQAGMPMESVSEGENVLVGYARDGFGLFGSKENGVVVKNEKLDACHGHTHEIFWDEILVSIYHYHVTQEFPYTVGCYAGTPVPI